MAIGGPPEVCWTLGLREPPVIHFAGRLGSVSAHPCCFLQVSVPVEASCDFRSLLWVGRQFLSVPVSLVAVFRSPTIVPVIGFSLEVHQLSSSGPESAGFSSGAAVLPVQSPVSGFCVIPTRFLPSPATV